LRFNFYSDFVSIISLGSIFAFRFYFLPRVFRYTIHNPVFFVFLQRVSSSVLFDGAHFHLNLRILFISILVYCHNYQAPLTRRVDWRLNVNPLAAGRYEVCSNYLLILSINLLKFNLFSLNLRFSILNLKFISTWFIFHFRFIAITIAILDIWTIDFVREPFGVKIS